MRGITASPEPYATVDRWPTVRAGGNKGTAPCKGRDGAGGVLVSDVTCAMVGDGPEFTFTDPATVRLKGFDRDDTVHRLDWQA